MKNPTVHPISEVIEYCHRCQGQLYNLYYEENGHKYHHGCITGIMDDKSNPE